LIKNQYDVQTVYEGIYALLHTLRYSPILHLVTISNN